MKGGHLYGIYPHTPYFQRENFSFAKITSLLYLTTMADDLHHHPEEETKALKTRVRKIVGQLNGIERMIESERDCAEILTQLVSARKALKSLSEKIIHAHLHHCIEGAQQPAEGQRRLREILAVLKRYVD